MFGHTTHRSEPRRSGGLFHRRDRDRVAGGYKAALSNPNTTREGRKRAKMELKMMVCTFSNSLPDRR